MPFLLDSIIYEDKKHGEKPPKVPVPKDKYLICHIVFFLLGVSHFLPISFLAAANNVSSPSSIHQNVQISFFSFGNTNLGTH